MTYKSWWNPLCFALFAIVLLTACSPGTAHKPAEKESFKERLAKAEAMFQERCKSAGEKILRTIDNVEGIFLLKVRPSGINRAKQFEMDDPYGSDFSGDAYIKSFLRGHYEAETSGIPIAGAPPAPKGYRYVEAIDPNDGKRYRFTGSVKEVRHTTSVLMGGDGKTTFVTKDFVLDKVLGPATPPRYGITYDDISTHEEREYWIAGSSLKVIDLKTNEVIAERIGYMMDRGQGNTSGGRSPWLFADDNACPTFQLNPLRPPGHGSIAKLRQTERFVEKTLKPKLEK